MVNVRLVGLGGFMGAASRYLLPEQLFLEGLWGSELTAIFIRSKVLRLSESLPVVVEIVDKADRIDAFLPVLDEMVTDGMITVGGSGTYSCLSP